MRLPLGNGIFTDAALPLAVHEEGIAPRSACRGPTRSGPAFGGSEWSRVSPKVFAVPPS